MLNIFVFIIVEEIARAILRDPFTDAVLNGTLSPKMSSFLLICSSVIIGLLASGIVSTIRNSGKQESNDAQSSKETEEADERMPNTDITEDDDEWEKEHSDS